MAINHQKPPSGHPQEMFRAGKHERGYKKTVDGITILCDKGLAVCPEPKAFLNTILTLGGGTALT